MTLAFNISALLILAGLSGIFLGLGRKSRETPARSGRPPLKRENNGGTAARPR